MCSIIKSECCSFTSFLKVINKFSISLKWSPVVGSSNMYSIRFLVFVPNSFANFILWDSPPLNPNVFCPSFRYPSPTSSNKESFLYISEQSLKNVFASATSMSSISAIVFPLYCIDSISFWYLLPWHSLQVTHWSAIYCRIIFVLPNPWQFGHCPFLLLKLK